MPSAAATRDGRPETVTDLGSSCLLCGDPFEPGQVAVPATADNRRGRGHEDCAEMAETAESHSDA